MIWPRRLATAENAPLPAPAAITAAASAHSMPHAPAGPPAQRSSDIARTIILTSATEEDNDPGFSFAEDKGEKRPRFPSILVRQAPTTSSQPTIRRLPKETRLELLPIPASETKKLADVPPAPQTAAATEKPVPIAPPPAVTAAEKTNPIPPMQAPIVAAEKITSPAPVQMPVITAEKTPPAVVATIPASTPADSKTATALKNPYEDAIPGDRPAPGRRISAIPSRLQSPLSASPISKPNPHPAAIPAMATQSGPPTASAIGVVAGTGDRPERKTGTPQLPVNKLAEPAPGETLARNPRPLTPLPPVNTPGPAGGTPLRNPFESGVPNDQPAARRPPAISAARPLPATPAALAGAAAPVYWNPYVADAAPAAYPETISAAQMPSGATQRTTYRLAYDGDPANPGRPVDPNMIPGGPITTPSVPGMTTNIPGVGATPQWPEQGPATFTPPARPNGPPADTGDTPGVHVGTPSDTVGMTVCEGTQILARVGSEVILLSDILPTLREIMTVNRDKLPTDPEQMEQLKQTLIKQFLQDKIQTKLAYLDVQRTFPKEGLEKQDKFMSDMFDREEIERLMKQMHAGSREELDQKLRAMGSSLEKMRRSYIEKTIAQMRIREQVKLDKIDAEVGPTEMLAYYRKHIDAFEKPAQGRWEELEVRLSEHANAQEAYALIVAMGNQVLQGKPFAEVARKQSEGPTAASGGQREWTSQGSLVSTELDRALFALPVGQMSQIIEDKTGFHIIRVQERKSPDRTPFLEAQVEIRKKIKDERRNNEMQQYLAKIHREIPVWTVFDSVAQNPSLKQR
jgi:parvulin-like peptidyl-prolyl isomerase